MLVFINTINHKVISLLPKSKSRPKETARAPKAFTSCIQSWGSLNTPNT